MKTGIMAKISILVLIITLLLGASACAGTVRSVPPPVPSPVPTDKVIINYFSFNPPNAVVTAGTAVTWINQDDVSYSITDNNGMFAFTVPGKGEFKFVFTQVGTYDYHCSIHPDMQGTIVVVHGVSCKAEEKTVGGRSGADG
jgi:plastocyanin